MDVTRQQLDELRDLPEERVDVPEWGGTVVVRTLTGTERDELDIANTKAAEALKDDNAWFASARLRLLCRVLYQTDGTPLFRPGEEAVLGRRHPRAIRRLFAVADRLNAISDRALEERAGKSGAAPGGATSTDSPSASAAATPTSSSGS